ncbi:thioredoxin domain-containing protein [Kaarinaea lacus]
MSGGALMFKLYTRVCLLLSLAWPLLVNGDSQLGNTMQGHGSPYLRLHEKDPVAWQQWGPQTVKLAKQKNKMLFVSIGYFSCHWCHVMQRESFSDQGIARLLNSNFIPVKVDRELNPALDAYLIEFVNRTRGSAGWPLNVIITPDGYPILGITYLPKAQFSTVLQQMMQLWQTDPAALKQLAQQAAQQLHEGRQLKPVELTSELAMQLAAQYTQQTMGIADEMSGGFGDKSKFPMTPQLNLLLSEYERKPQASLKSFLELTLDHMATQGLRDQIGGGFYRYTIDPTWQTPHFEKMLYDNAQLALLYMRAAKLLQREDYAGIGRETLNFMLRELQGAKGAFISSLSAVDNADVEGGYYLWQEDTLKKLLSKEEFEIIYLLWDMSSKPELAPGYLPRQVLSPDQVAKQLGLDEDEVLKLMASSQWKLFQARQQRSIPRDEKLLAAWNGLALQALVAGARQEPAANYKQAARQLRNYLVQDLWDGKNLLRARAQQQTLAEGTLEDYAFAAMGLWQWHLLTGDNKDRELVKRWVALAWQQFYDDTGWRLTSQSLLPQDYGEPLIKDAPLPSASATLIDLSLQLAQRENDRELRKKAMRALSIGFEQLTQSPFTYPSQIQLLVSYFASTEKQPKK